MHCAAGWATNMRHASLADASMAGKIMSALPHSTLCPCWKRKGQSRPFQYFTPLYRQCCVISSAQCPSIEYWRIQSARLHPSSASPQRLLDGGCRERKVVMTTHGTSRFKSCPENRDRRRLAWELRASWKMLGFSKRGSRLQISWLRARRSNGFSRPAVSPWAQWSQVTGAAVRPQLCMSASSCRPFDLDHIDGTTFLDLVGIPFSLPYPIFTALSTLAEPAPKTWQVLAIAKNTNKLSYFHPQSPNIPNPGWWRRGDLGNRPAHRASGKDEEYPLEINNGALLRYDAHCQRRGEKGHNRTGTILVVVSPLKLKLI